MKSEYLIEYIENMLNISSTNFAYAVYDSLKMDNVDMDVNKINGIARIVSGSFEPIRGLGSSSVTISVEFIYPYERLDAVKETCELLAKSSAGLVVDNSAIHEGLQGTTGISIVYPVQGNYFNGTLGETAKTRIICYFDINEKAVLANQVKLEVQSTDYAYTEKYVSPVTAGTYYIKSLSKPVLGLYSSIKVKEHPMLERSTSSAQLNFDSGYFKYVGAEGFLDNQKYEILKNSTTFKVVKISISHQAFVEGYKYISRATTDDGIYLQFRGDITENMPTIYAIDETGSVITLTPISVGTIGTGEQVITRAGYTFAQAVGNVIITDDNTTTAPADYSNLFFKWFVSGLDKWLFAYGVGTTSSDTDLVYQSVDYAKLLELLGLNNITLTSLTGSMGLLIGMFENCSPEYAQQTLPTNYSADYPFYTRSLPYLDMPYYKYTLTRHRLSTTNKFENNNEMQTINDGQSIDLSVAVPSIGDSVMNGIKDDMLNGTNLGKTYNFRLTDESGVHYFDNMLPSGDFVYEVIPGNNLVLKILFVYKRL